MIPTHFFLGERPSQVWEARTSAQMRSLTPRKIRVLFKNKHTDHPPGTERLAVKCRHKLRIRWQGGVWRKAASGCWHHKDSEDEGGGGAAAACAALQEKKNK